MAYPVLNLIERIVGPLSRVQGSLHRRTIWTLRTKYEVTTARLTPQGRVKRTQVVEADGFKQERGTATFADENGRAVAKIKHVVRVCWP